MKRMKRMKRMKKRALAAVLAMTLSLQGSMQITASSEQTQSFSETEISEETETGTGNVLEDSDIKEIEEGLESPVQTEKEVLDEEAEKAGSDEAESDKANSERTWVLDEDDITFTAGIPTVEFTEETEEDTERTDSADPLDEDEFVIDIEELDGTEELQSEQESETEQFQSEGNISDDSAALSLSVADAWIVCRAEDQTEEKTAVPVEDNQLRFTDYSASSIIELGYSLYLNYSGTEDAGLKAGDELLLSLPARYLDYEEVMPDVFEMEDTAGQKIQAGTFEIEDNEMRIAFGDDVESANFVGGQGYIELRAKLKYEALLPGMQAKETLLLPERLGDCVVQASSEIALTLPMQDLQQESTEMSTQTKDDAETETDESEKMSEDSAVIATIAEETMSESAVIPPLEDWYYILSLDKNNKTGEIRKAIVYLYYYYGTDEVVSIPETYTVNGISYDVVFRIDPNLFDSVFANKKVRKVIFPEKDTVQNGSMESFFRSCENLEGVVNLDKQTTYDISGIFSGCTSLITAPKLPVSVRDMSSAFSGCTSLVAAPEIPPSVTDMYNTFSGCKMLEDAPEIPPSVINMDGTFNGCKMLREAPEIPSLVTDMDNTFKSCTSLVSAPVIPKSVTNMEGTFCECESLINAPEIPSLVRSLTHTFDGCVSLEKVPDLPDSVTDMSYTFDRCSALVNAPKLSASVTNMNYTFERCISLANAPEIPATVTNMEGTFYGCTSLINVPELPECVTDMGYTFYNCASLADAPELPASVTDIRSAFSGCNSLENAPEIPSSVTNIRDAFNGCASLTSAPEIPLSVTDMSYAFSGCRLLEKAPRIPTSVTNMENTFAGCSLLVNAPKIPSSVTNMVETFAGCISLVKAPDIPDSVMNMRGIFIGCRNLQGNMTIYTALEDAAYHWKNAFSSAAINDTGLVVNYCEENAHVIDDIIASKGSSRSNIVKGQCVEKPISSVTETGEYLLRITDTAGEALADVEVVYGMLDALHTNKRGEVTLRFTEAELAGADRLEDAAEDAKKRMHTLRLKKEGYQEQVRENYLFDEENTAPVIRLLKTGEEALASAVLLYEKTEYDILDHDASVDVSGAIFGTSKTFSLRFATEKQETDQYEFAIRQGKKTVARGGENGMFELSCSAFAAGKDAYLDFIDKSTGAIVKSEKLRLHFIDSSKLPSKIELGSSFKIHVDDNMPLLGGKEFSVNSLNFPLDFSVDGNGKVRVGVNIEMEQSKCGFVSGDSAVTGREKEWSGRTAFSETLEKLLSGEASNLNFEKLRARLKQKDKYTSSGAVSLSVNFGGYLEGTVSDLYDMSSKNDLSALKNLKGSIFGEVKVKVSSETGFAVVFIPCVCAIDGSGAFKTSVKWDHGINVNMEPSAGLTLYCGVGWPSVVSGGFYGEGKLKADILLSTFKEKEKNGLKEMTLSGNAGFMGRVLGKELVRVSLINGTYNIYRNGGVSPANLYSSYPVTLQEEIVSAISDTDTDIVEEVDRDYLEKRSEWEGAVSDAANEVQVLQSDTYIDIQPTIISAANGKVMVWLDDLGDTRDSANRTAVVYSVFDETASAWSKPQALEDDGTADFSPMVCSDGSDIYVIWQDAKEALASDMTLTDQSVLLELNTARINIANKECVLLGEITDNDEYEMEPVLSVGHGTLTAQWYVNSENNPLGAAGKNVFCSASYRDGAWTQAQAMAESGLILTKAVGSLGESIYTVTGEDEDMDLTTTEDRKLYLCAEGSTEKKELSSGITGKVHAALIHGENAFCWAEGASIKYITAPDGAVQTLQENSPASGCDYQIFGDNDGNMSIVYFAVKDAQTEVMLQSYDPARQTWGKPVTLVNNGKYIERVSGYYESGRLTLAFSQTEITDMESLKTVSDFCYMVLDGHAKPEVIGVDYEPSEVKAGGDLELTLTVKNAASDAAENVSAQILDESGTEVAVASSEESLAGGNTAELKCTVTLPQEKGIYCYTARTDTSTYEFTLGQGELAVIAKKESYTTSDRIAVHIRNIGMGTIGGKLELYNYEDEDEIYLTETIPELNGGDTYLFRCRESSLYTVTGEPHKVGVRVKYDGGEKTDFLIMDSSVYTVTFEQGFYGNNETTEVKVRKGTQLTPPEIADILGWYVDEDLTMEWNFGTPVSGNMTLYAKWDRCEEHDFETEVVEPTCTEKGYTLYSCKNCNYWYKDDYVDMADHNWETLVEEPTCEREGRRVTKCTHCGTVLSTEEIARKDHTWGDWAKVTDATVFSEATESRACVSCGQKDMRKVGDKLKPVLRLTANSLKMRQKQSTKKFKVEEMAAGDSILSVVSSNKKLLQVSSIDKKLGTFKLKAKNKKGTAKLTVTLASGVSKTIKIKVQAKKVTTSKVTLRSKNVTLSKGKKLSLKPVIAPVTSQDKVTYKSSNKKVVTVSPKGVIKAVKKGSAKITVKSGKKKAVCIVVVK